MVARLRDWNYLRKWLVLGILIGVVAGLGAIAFIFALEGTSKLILETLGGYKPPLPIGEGIASWPLVSPVHGRSRWWLASEG